MKHDVSYYKIQLYVGYVQLYYSLNIKLIEMENNIIFTMIEIMIKSKVKIDNINHYSSNDNTNKAESQRFSSPLLNGINNVYDPFKTEIYKTSLSSSSLTWTGKRLKELYGRFCSRVHDIMSSNEGFIEWIWRTDQ